MNPDGDVREINSIKEELKRINQRAKLLRTQKKEAESRLYRYMLRNDLEKYEGITLKSIEPKQPRPRKPVKAKKKDALALFYEVGIPDPDSFWEEFQQTQKYVDGEAPPPPQKSPGKSYDPFLGF